MAAGEEARFGFGGKDCLIQMEDLGGQAMGLRGDEEREVLNMGMGTGLVLFFFFALLVG